MKHAVPTRLLLLVTLVFSQDVITPQLPTAPPTFTQPTTTTTIADLLTQTTTLPIAADCTETDATWLAWSEWSSCSDQCGSCGIHIRSRTCLATQAPCTCPGESTKIEYCNLEICRYPRTTCCNNLKVTSLSGRFACLVNSTFTGDRVVSG